MFKKIEGIIIFILVFFLFTTLFIRFFGVKTFVVQSDSMAPNYRINDLVYVKKFDSSKDVISVNDVIAFNQNGSMVMHRIIYMDSNKIITKGDNNNIQDAEISYSQVLGSIIFKVPLGGLLLNQYVLIITGGLYFITHLSIKIYKETKKG